MSNAIKSQQYVKVVGSEAGGTELMPIVTLNEASAFYRKFCDDNFLGSSGAGNCYIYSDGKVVAHVSYNGKVWAGRKWVSGDKPLYDPYTEDVEASFREILDESVTAAATVVAKSVCTEAEHAAFPKGRW